MEPSKNDVVDESSNPAKMENASTELNKSFVEDHHIPAEDQPNQNNEPNLIGCSIKGEPSEETFVNVTDTPTVRNKDQIKMDRNSDGEDSCENTKLKKIKTEESESIRRKSLRNENAAATKKKPPKYDEIFNCYKRKEYKECIIYIELVSELAKDCVEYSILKAACYINLGVKLSESHKILDEVLKQRPGNVFTIYTKGLAYYQEQNWEESIKCFEKSIALDKTLMQRAEVMLKLAKEELEKRPELPVEEEHEEDERFSESNDEDEGEEDGEDEDEEDEDDDGQDSGDETLGTLNESKHARNIRNKRFGCELCGKYFGKKFNLDRHNKTIHNRDTPYIAPLPRHYGRKSDADSNVEINTEVMDVEETEHQGDNAMESDSDYEDLDDTVDIDVPVETKKSKFKIRIGGHVAKKSSSLASLKIKKGMARCKVCKKMYRKGSLARHEIIHTGNKPHKCEQCPMAFYQKSDLQRHVTIHSDQFDFECELCDKKFRIKKNLQVHNKRHHSSHV